MPPAALCCNSDANGKSGTKTAVRTLVIRSACAVDGTCLADHFVVPSGFALESENMGRLSNRLPTHSAFLSQGWSLCSLPKEIMMPNVFEELRQELASQMEEGEFPEWLCAEIQVIADDPSR